MKTENGVYLLIDNELKEVKEYSNEPDARVVVVYQGTVVVIPPKNFGEADYYNAMKIAEANGMKLGNKPDWTIVDLLLDEVNETLELLGHDIIKGSYWTCNEFTSSIAWNYSSHGGLYTLNKRYSIYVRPLLSFPLNALNTK